MDADLETLRMADEGCPNDPEPAEPSPDPTCETCGGTGDVCRLMGWRWATVRCDCVRYHHDLGGEA